MQYAYSLRTVRGWLHNYEAIVAGDRREGFTGNASAKAYDGVSGKVLMRIMLTSAVDSLPQHIRRAVRFRWMYHVRRSVALEVLGCTKHEYYAWCEEGIELVWKFVNGDQPAWYRERASRS